MKLRSVLNGLAALTAVGVFYTFAFCMVDEVDDAEISQEYYYNTATQTVTEETVTEQVIASVNKTPSYTYNKEMAETPQPEDIDNVNEQMEINPSYQDTADENAALNITPLVTPEAPTAETTVVPENESSEFIEKTEIAEPVIAEPIQTVAENNAAASAEDPETVENEENFDDIPEDIEADFILSENMMGEPDKNYMDSLDYKKTESINEINKTMEQMQQALSSPATVTTAPEDVEFVDYTVYTTVPTNVVTSIGTHFETIPTVTTVTEATESIVTTAPSGKEMFTARVDGSVQEFDAYELVCMIVSTEMSPSFNKEALKAQAVAAYSYVKYHNVNGLVPTVLVKRTIPDEVRDAVSAVWGKCVYYNGKPAQTVYTASSAGTTASAVNVWGGDNFPYLSSVATDFDVQSDPNYGVITTYTKDQIKTALEGYLGITLSDNPENWMVITGRVDGNYVSSVSIDGQTSVSGRKIRESVLKYGIKSWCFDVSYADGVFTFITYGYGHGVGMSQNGANILGKQGYTYDRILNYYFPGTVVE